MDFSNPFAGMGPDRPLNPIDTAAALRLDAAAELDAINLYQAHIDAIADPEIRRVIESVRDDEKEHLAEFMAAIKRLDPVQAREFNGAVRVMATVDGTDIDARLRALDARIKAIDDRLSGTIALGQTVVRERPWIEFRRVTPGEFIRARAGSKRPEMLTPYSEADLSSMETYLSADGKVGYALTPDKDLVNVFNNSGIPGAGQAAVIDAIKRGAETLDCFAGFLPQYYAQVGFRAYRSDPWNDEYAPVGWDYARLDRPDIIYMRYEGGPRDTIEQRIGTFPDYYAYPWEPGPTEGQVSVGGETPPTVRPGMVGLQPGSAGYGMGVYPGTRSRWEDALRRHYGQEWLDRNRARLDMEWEYIQELGGPVALPQNIPAEEYLERRHRGNESAYREQLERERAIQEAWNEALRREIAEREAREGTAYACSLPGESAADWVSGISGSPGIEYQPEAASAGPCIRLSLGEGFKPLVFAKGIIGALDESQISRYCTKGFIDREASPKQKERINAMSEAAKICKAETQGIQGTEEHLTRYFSCLGRELKAKGVEI